MSFSNSLRSLKADRSRLAMTLVILIILIWVVWGAWFFLARIPFYETSRTAQLTLDGIIIAQFPPESLVQIQTGQPAFFRLADLPGQSNRIPAVVVEVSVKAGEVQLIPQAGAEIFDYLEFEDGVGGQVEIVVERVSPATLVMRAAGLVTDS